MVRPKKHLGQHFLTDESYAKRIVSAASFFEDRTIIEVGPGTGVLSKYILGEPGRKLFSEVDHESITYLQEHYNLEAKDFIGDFLQLNIKEVSQSKIGVIGNFPYNISSQILFQVYRYVDSIEEVVGMFQKEVARRVSSSPGNKEYGILSVLMQAYFDIEYLFTVPPGAFFPPPKVDSGVIRLRKAVGRGLASDPDWYLKVVKMAFNQRRKTLRNALKPMWQNMELTTIPFESKRAEQLNFKQFDELAVALKES